MNRRIKHRLRSERRTWGLTQKELAPLLFIRDATQLCRIERGLRDPNAVNVIAASLVFGRSLNELFPGLKHEINEELLARTFALFQQVEKDVRPEGQKKRELLQAIISRGLA